MDLSLFFVFDDRIDMPERWHPLGCSLDFHKGRHRQLFVCSIRCFPLTRTLLPVAGALLLFVINLTGFVSNRNRNKVLVLTSIDFRRSGVSETFIVVPERISSSNSSIMA